MKEHPLWTENKANLIQRYLYYFVFITHHGTYIDGFAGPQSEAVQDAWSAKMVLETKPSWLRHFRFFDKSRGQLARLESLRAVHPERDIRIYAGDFNSRVHEMLAAHEIGEREATFCLLDQRTFECHWSTVEALARYGPRRMKIELFYFLANAWLPRALKATRNIDTLRAWWGRDDFRDLQKLRAPDRVQLMRDRFASELGYRSVEAYPIFQRRRASRIMYYMLHAADHPESPKLMTRAYNRLVEPPESAVQLALEFGCPLEDAPG